MKKYRVWLRTIPGFHTQYDGKIDIYADNDDEAIDRALQRLKRGSFKDYSDDMWMVEKLERIFT